MRIAYLVNQYPKVSHSFIRREILALERHGFEIMRISIRGWNSELVDEADLTEREKTRYLLKGNRLAIVLAALACLLSRPVGFARAMGLLLTVGWRAERPLPYHFIYLAEACLVLRWLRDDDIKHLHAHFGTNSAEVAMLVHALGGPPFSFTVHGPEEFDKPAFLGLPEKIRRAAFVVAVSSFGRSQLFRMVNHQYWYKIQVVRCGLEQSYFETPQTSHLPSDLICVGRLCEQKGQLLLLEAARRLSLMGRLFSLTLAGDGELRSEIQHFIERYGLKEKVHVAGWISNDEVRRRIQNSRALILPSFAEGLPVVIMEAMALRRPVISTYVAGIPELVEASENGWLVPAGDVEALTAAIEQCLDATSETLLKMSDAGFEKAIRLHSIDRETAVLAFLLRAAPASEAVGSY